MELHLSLAAAGTNAGGTARFAQLGPTVKMPSDDWTARTCSSMTPRHVPAGTLCRAVPQLGRPSPILEPGSQHRPGQAGVARTMQAEDDRARLPC